MNQNEILNSLATLIRTANPQFKGISFELAFENFINYSKLNCREATINYYKKTFKPLFKALNLLGITYTNELKKTDYKQLETLFKSLKYKNSSINKFTDLLKMIYKVNIELEYIDYNPIFNIKKLKEDKVNIEIITPENMYKIMTYLKSLHLDYFNTRNILSILLLKDTGVRLNELLHIKKSNINIDDNSIYLEYTKTRDTRIVFFTDLTKSYLLKHLENDKEEKVDYLFLNHLKDNCMEKCCIYHFLDRISKACKIEQSITPHKWRHTFITNLVEHNVNLNSIMKVSGHTVYSTTQRYIHQSHKSLKDSIFKAL
jgi:site-specific recombinase XerD